MSDAVNGLWEDALDRERTENRKLRAALRRIEQKCQAYGVDSKTGDRASDIARAALSTGDAPTACQHEVKR